MAAEENGALPTLLYLFIDLLHPASEVVFCLHLPPDTLRVFGCKKDPREDQIADGTCANGASKGKPGILARESSYQYHIAQRKPQGAKPVKPEKPHHKAPHLVRFLRTVV